VALVSLKVYAPVSAAGLPLGASVVIGPGYPWDGAKRATYKEATHQPKGLTAREGAAGQGSSQLVEGALSRFCGDRLAPFPEGRDSSVPPCCTTRSTMKGYKAWRNFRESPLCELRHDGVLRSSL